MRIFESIALKRLGVSITFVLIALSAYPLPTHAQVVSTTTGAAAGTTTSPGSTVAPSGTAITPTQDGGDCSLTHPTTWGDCVVKAVAGVVLTVANFLLATAGTLLNWVVVKAVFQFGSLIGNSPGVLVAWGILRDIGNMVLLFGFIFMGIATILDLHTFSAKKALPSLLIFAILMNFSLFAAEAVIDTSNALSSSLYAQTNSNPCNGITGTVAAGGQTDEDCAVNYGIAGHIMQSTGLSSIFEANSSSFTAESVTYIMLALFATIGAVVLFAAAIMLAVRLIILSFLMVVSPIGFAGMAIPPLRRFAGEWWRRLIGESFFAPVLFLLIFISLKITDTFAAADTRGSLAAAVQQPGASTMGIVMIFTIVIGFLIASLIVARRIGSSSAGFAVNLATRAVYGGMARGTNLAFGGSAAAAKYFQQRYAPNSRVGKAITQRVLTPLTTTNLDMRRTPGMNKLLSVAGAGDAAKPSEHVSFKDMQHQYQDIRDNKKGQERDRKYDEEVGILNLEKNAHHGKLEDDDKKFLSNMSTKQLEELHGIKEGSAALAENLSPKQFENLMKSDKLSELEKGNLRQGRFSTINAFVQAGDTDGVKGALKGMGKKELENMPSAILMEPIVLDNLSDKQRDDLGGSEERSGEERRTIKESSKVERIKKAFDDPAIGGAGIVSGISLGPGRTLKFSDLTREQVAKLPKEVLTDANVAKQFTPNVLMALQEEKGKFTPKDIQDIARHITSLGSGPAYDYVNGKDSPGKIFWS